MREFFHNMKLSFLLAAVLYVILGLVLLIWPGVSATVFCYAFGGILLATPLEGGGTLWLGALWGLLSGFSYALLGLFNQ